MEGNIAVGKAVAPPPERDDRPSGLALALVAHPPQQLSLLVFSHLLATLLDYAAHGWISMLGLLEGGEI